MTTGLPPTERALASLELLYAIGRELAGQLDLRQLLQRVLDRTLESVGAASGSILVLDAGGQAIEGALAYDGKGHDHTAERLAGPFQQGPGRRGRQAGPKRPDRQHPGRSALAATPPGRGGRRFALGHERAAGGARPYR